MSWITHLMDWLPRLIWALAGLAFVACCLRLKIRWVRAGSIEFLGFKWPWRREGKDDPAV